ncbi:synaptic vesicle transporter [Aspergillus homomorphus CBS 101889]|uniref:Synaptic vesicle transporter n=1 Tax=Aspergillus homomorphus (strain CBS 101889) TaxID=1450537 RepID=A0A395HZE9_ASPHC|nr:synaptic vesicle transporter [Aspergillus homomorphus CBS 101889]RAL13301.1 synaptic vesicle transporter [Aspergillus homomorphus CBS 101889]
MTTQTEKPRDEEDFLHHEAARRGMRRTGSRTMEWNPEHQDYPRNWPIQRKTYDMTVMFFLEFYTTIISTTGPSAATKAMKEYGLSRIIALTGFQFMYGVGQALGGLIMPPFSESLGRKKSYLVSAGAYSISCLLVGVVPSPAGVFIGRFISGYASSVPAIVLAGSIEDMYSTSPRLWLLWLWNCSTILGLCVGPIYGSYIVSAIGWRWVYYTAASICAGLFILLLFVSESRPTTLLSRRFEHLKSKVGSRLDGMQISNPDRIDNKHELVQVILVRPARLGVSEPIVITVSILSASAWGMMYLFTESFTVVYGQFGWSSRATSLPFLALIPGIVASGLVRIWDHHTVHRRLQNKDTSPEPEDKIRGFALGAPALAIGLWIFGWTVPPLVHGVPWIASMFPLAVIGFAATEFSYTLSGYIADAYTIYASTGLAVVSFLRGIASACMPLFAYPMYAGLGSNIATSIIAAVATVFAVTPFLFLRFGKRLRLKSPFARYSAEVNERHGGGGG